MYLKKIVLNCNDYQSITTISNLQLNYELILRELRKLTKTENFNFKPIKPKLSDIEVISLIILTEFKSIDSKNQLFREIQRLDIGSKIERSVYKKETAIVSLHRKNQNEDG